MSIILESPIEVPSQCTHVVITSISGYTFVNIYDVDGTIFMRRYIRPKFRKEILLGPSESIQVDVDYESREVDDLHVEFVN